MINFLELKNIARKIYPALLLEKFSSYQSRKIIRTIIFWILIVLFLAMMIGPTLPNQLGKIVVLLEEYNQQFRSAFFLVFSVWFSAYLLKAFYFSYYFRRTDIDFEVAKLVINADADDITKSFLDSDIGKYTMVRLAIGEKHIKDFLENRKIKITESNFNLEKDLS